MAKFFYSSEQLQFLRDLYPLLTCIPLTAQFNVMFGLNKSTVQILSCLQRHNILSGRTSCFKKGTSGRTKPIGAERVGDGYIRIKVNHPNIWTKKHLKVWIDEHGPIPKNHFVVFKDHDKLNCDRSNLALINTSERRYLQVLKFQECLPEHVEAILLIAKLQAKTREKIKCVNKREKN